MAALFANPFAKAAPKPGRGRARTGKERLELEEARFLATIKKDDPDLWKAIMQQRLGYRGAGSEIDRFLELQDKLSRLGVATGQSKFDKLLEHGPDLLAMVLGGSAAAAQRMQQPPAVAPSPAVAAPAPVPSLPEAAPKPRRRLGPRRRRAERHAAADATPPAEPSEQPPTIGEYLLAGLSDGQGGRKTPADAAAWLCAQDEPLVQDLIAGLLQTPDLLLGRALEQAGKDPDWQPFVSWLQADMAWTKLAVAEVRRLAKATPA